MNRIILSGRVTQDIKLTELENCCFAKFTIAAKDEDRLKETDFINCIVWNERAKNFSEMVKKGSYINITGSLKNKTYNTDNGTKHYSEVLVKNYELVCHPKNDFASGDNSSLLNLDMNQFNSDSEEPF